jgi:hypothetical protein
MTVDEGVETAQRIGLLKAAIGFDCRGEALVAKEKPNGLIFSRMCSQETASPRDGGTRGR